jgi:hypothetical protein
MRQIELPFSNVDAECKGGSCLSELSIQIGVVFTTKTIAAQFVEIFKPWIQTYLRYVAQKLQLDKLKAEMVSVVTTIQQIALPDSMEEVSAAFPLSSLPSYQCTA